MLVSIIIPTSNGAQTLGRVLRSVLSQDYENMEILIIDNGSEDNTEEVVQGLMSESNREIRYYKYQHKLGHAGAINEGIKRALGKMIIVLHDDVVLCQNNWVSSMIRLFEDQKVGVASSLFITDPKDLKGIDRVFSYVYILGWHEPNNNLQVQPVMYTGLNNDMIRGEVIERIGLLDNTYKYGMHDLDFSEKVRRYGWNIVLNPKVHAKHLLSFYQRSLKSHLIKAWQYGFPSYLMMRRYGYLPNLDNLLFFLMLILFFASFILPFKFVLFTTFILLTFSFFVEQPNFYGKSKFWIRFKKVLISLAAAIALTLIWKNLFFIGIGMTVPLYRALNNSLACYKETKDLKCTLQIPFFYILWSLINGAAVFSGILIFPIKTI